MKIQQKIIFLLISGLIAFFGIILVYQYVRSKEIVIYKNFKLKSDREIVSRVMDLKTQGYLRAAIDNAVWDELVDFIKTNDTAWANANLGTTIYTFDFAAMLVYDKEGSVVYDVSMSGETPKFDIKKLKGIFDSGHVVHSYEIFEGKIYEIFGSVVVPSFDINYTTPPQGYFIACKSVDSLYLGKLGEATGFSVDLVSGTEEKLIPNPEDEAFAIPLLNSRGTYLSSLTFSRMDEMTDELEEVKIITITGLAMVIFFVLGIFLLIRSWITNPLTAIAGILKKHETGRLGKLSMRKDEFGEVARILRDYEHQKAELIISREEALEADKLKSHFLANMSHEIRTPINQIMGFAELLYDEQIPEVERRKFLGIIRNSGRQLLALINDILDISRIESNQIELHRSNFNLNYFLDDIFLTFSKTLNRVKDTQVILLLEKPVPDAQAMINSDDVRLRQILNNLLGNAIKFTHAGTIRFGYRTENDHLLFFVKDTGMGIPAEKLSWVFDRFRQVEEAHTRHHKGAGLGLSISLGLVELFGGKIWVESEEGKGSTFFFTLPARLEAMSETEPVKPVWQGKQSYDFSGKTILLAEDVEVNVNLIQWMLKSTKVNILVANNGLDAVELCRSDQHIQLVMMDIQMPGINGYEATRRIHEFRPELPVVALTAYANEEDQEESVKAGCADFIPKPIKKQLLLETLAKYLLS